MMSVSLVLAFKGNDEARSDKIFQKKSFCVDSFLLSSRFLYIPDRIEVTARNRDEREACQSITKQSKTGKL